MEIDVSVASFNSEADETGSWMTSRYRYVIGSLIGLLMFSSALSMFSIGPVTPLIIADYGVNKSTAGFLTGVTFLVHTIFSLPITFLTRRLSLKTAILLGGLCASAPLFTFMAADNFSLLLALRAVHGLSFIFLFCSGGPLIMQWFSSNERPLMNGVFLVCASIGVTIASFIVAPMAEIMNWSVVISGFGGLSLLSAFLWLLLGKAQKIHTDDEGIHPMRHFWHVLLARNTWLVGAADAGPFALLCVSMAWLPVLYHDVHGMSLTATGIYMGVLSLAGVVGLTTASLLTVRTPNRRPFLVIPGIVIGCAGLVTIVLGDSVALYIAIGVLGFACWFYLPALMTIPMDLYPNDPNKVAITYSTLISIGGIASFIGPPSIGAIADLTGSLVPGLVAFAVLSWSLVIAGMLLPSTVTIKSNSVR